MSGSSEKAVTSQLQAIKSALSFENYRNNYEATNSYTSNMSKLNSIEETMRIAIAASGPTEGQKVLLADVDELKKMWDQKKLHREQGIQQKEAMMNSEANKAEWLKQLKEEEEQHEKEAKKAQESKSNAKKKRAQDRKEKRNQRRGLDDSDSDEEGGMKGKGNKGRHAGMERGSSLLAQLAGVDGEQEDDGSEDEAGQRRVAGGGKKSGGASPTSQNPAGSLKSAGGVTPLVYYRNVPISLIPKELLELVIPEEGTAEAAAAASQVLCTVQPIPNSPMVEMTFTAPYSGKLPAPRRVIPLNHHQLKDIHQPHFKGKAKKAAEAEEGTRPKQLKRGDKDKEVQIQWRDIDLPDGPQFTVKATMWRVVVAAHLTEYKHVVTPVPDALKDYIATEEARNTAMFKKNKGGKKDKSAAGKQGEDEDDDEDDDEMVLQHTPDDIQEHINQLLGDDDDDDEDDEEEEAPTAGGKKQKKKDSVLDDLSSQLVAQYHEDEHAEEEDDYLRHAKARDIPSVMTRSMTHLHPLSESTWVILMCHGGHFAGAVFVNGKAILHKAFHRYVVRKKQGGKQSKHLKGGGSMNSIGGQIRHAHELKWKSEVRDIILMWKEHIQKANMILYVAPGPDNRAILTDWKDTPQSQLSRNLGPLATDSPISLKDPRVRGVPYTTKRPTFGEVTSIFETISCCHVGFYRTDGKDGGAYTGHRNHNYAVDLPDEEGAFYF